MMGEFEMIGRFFSRPARRAALGVGDDCALVEPGEGMQLAVSTDMLVEGRHFLPTVPPRRLGHKALAVNLSDLAACGAEPLAFTFAWSLPRADEAFVAPLAEGLWALADEHGIELVGGDTTAGPLNLCLTAMGRVPRGQALLRSGARPGDDLWVSGWLGDARLALEVFRGRLALDAAAFEQVRLRMEMPSPRVTLGLALRGLASSAIDLSDGLVGDLGHVLKLSRVGARVHVDDLPCSPVLAAQPTALRRQCLLAGGDDYELLFTAAPSQRQAVLAAGRSAGVAVTRVGVIEPAGGLVCVDSQGREIHGDWHAFDHFA